MDVWADDRTAGHALKTYNMLLDFVYVRHVGAKIINPAVQHLITDHTWFSSHSLFSECISKNLVVITNGRDFPYLNDKSLLEGSACQILSGRRFGGSVTSHFWRWCQEQPKVKGNELLYLIQNDNLMLAEQAACSPKYPGQACPWGGMARLNR
ncbi:MAG: hypothetical protein MUC85_11725 [Anaerolineales bacterium]|jgi:hypothetical protein|nr:hypothetical protein [Anaerolineales bacterium]